MAGQGHKFGALQSIWQDAPTTFGLPSPLPSVLGGEGGSDDTLNRKTAKRFHSSVKQTVETTHMLSGTHSSFLDVPCMQVFDMQSAYPYT